MLTFDGKGSLLASNGYVTSTVDYTYNADKKTLKFSFIDYDFDGKYDGTNLIISDEYEEILINSKFTKKAEETLDEIAGTWTFGDWVLTFDGKGSLLASNGSVTSTVDYTYNADKKTLTFTFIGYEFDGKYDGTNLIISDEYEEILISNKFTKAA